MGAHAVRLSYQANALVGPFDVVLVNGHRRLRDYVSIEAVGDCQGTMTSALLMSSAPSSAWQITRAKVHLSPKTTRLPPREEPAFPFVVERADGDIPGQSGTRPR